MSADPTLPSEELPGDVPGMTPEDGENEQDWLPKVKRRHRKNEAGAETGEASDREILVLCSLLLTNLLDKRTSGTDSPPAEATRAKVNRFPGKTSLPAMPGAAAVPGAAVGMGVPATDAPAPATAVPVPFSPQIKLKPRTAEGASREGQWNKSSTWEKALAYAMIALVVTAFFYFVGRRLMHSAVAARSANPSQAIAPPAKLTTTWSPALIAQLDAVLTADRSGDLRNAGQLAADLKKRLPDSADLDLYLASLQIRAGEYDRAEENVAKMMNGFTPPLLTAAIKENLGFNYARKRNLPMAVSSFADAAAADPFSAVHFYHWGEALRRKGQLREAIDHLGEALTRLPAGQPDAESLRGEVEFKINLTRIELGKDEEEMKAAVAEHLKNPAPTGYWLLTAAANAMQHGDMATAAGDLRRARGTLSPENYTVLTNDYFLRGFAERDEVSALLNPGSAASRAQFLQPRTGYFIDP